jgi:protein ImuB
VSRRARIVVCATVPRFALRVAADRGGRLPDEPVALGPEPGGAALVGEANPAAEAFGVRAGMRVGEAIARCPALELVPPDPGATVEAAEEVLAGLEALGAAPEPLAPGAALFAGEGLLRLHGGLSSLLAAVALGLPPGGRVGAGPGRFVAHVAAETARRGRPVRVEPDAVAAFLARLPVERLPLAAAAADELRALGIRTAGELAALPLPAVADRLGGEGIRAWRLARGEDSAYISPRTPPEPIAEELRFPDPAGDELALRRALAILIERALGRRERRGRPPRVVTLTARLAGGGSWLRPVPLREPTSDASRLRDALAPKLLEVPAAVDSLALELTALAAEGSRQEPLLDAPEALRRRRAAEAARQVRAGLGEGHLLRFVDVAPWSRIPEARGLLVPYDG